MDDSTGKHPLPIVFVVPGKEGTMEQVSVALPIIKIGRQDRSHVKIDHPSVSRMHAVIEVVGDRASLIDLGSGTKVNGQPVNKIELSHGDTITMGEVTIRVGIGGAP